MELIKTPMRKCIHCGWNKPETLKYFNKYKRNFSKVCIACSNVATPPVSSAPPAIAGKPDQKQHAIHYCRSCKGTLELTVEHALKGHKGLKGGVYLFYCSECRSEVMKLKELKSKEKRRVWYKKIGFKYHHIRRARKVNAGGVFSRQDLERQYTMQKGKCWWCLAALKGEYHADHLIPLARGGSNNPENIVCACAHCNLSKGAKLPSEWIGRLF